MYNIGFICNNVMTEIKLTAMLESEGICWSKSGRMIKVYGCDEETRDIIEKKADRIYAL